MKNFVTVTKAGMAKDIWTTKAHVTNRTHRWIPNKYIEPIVGYIDGKISELKELKKKVAKKTCI